MMMTDVKSMRATFLMGLILCCGSVFAAHKHGVAAPPREQTCIDASVTCAATVTSAFAPNGDLWRLWSQKKKLYFAISQDKGKTFSAARAVPIAAEAISSRNENRPKIAFDKFQGVYLSWASPREKKYTADVRFSYSPDYGRSFSPPVTVNNDNLLAGHSFNEMSVTEEGEVSIVWLDGRLSHRLRQQGKESKGSALFLATANLREGKTQFNNQRLANETCVCCRIAVDVNRQGNLAIFWRQIYGDNIREFAILTLDEQETPYRVSHDHWQIHGCPHQGGGLSIDDDNRYHMVWFNLGDKGKGIFYASSTDQGKTVTTPLAIGKLTGQASHPHVGLSGARVDIVWIEFNGAEHELWHQKSMDNGESFSQAKQIARASSGADRPFIINYGGRSYVSWQRLRQGHWIQAL